MTNQPRPYNITEASQHAARSDEISRERRTKPLLSKEARRVALALVVTSALALVAHDQVKGASTDIDSVAPTAEISIVDSRSVWNAVNTIAEETHGNRMDIVEQIKALNGLENFSNLQPGQTLKVPAVLPEDNETHVG